MNTKKPIAPIFLFSSIEKVKEHANYLSVLGRQANYSRQHDLVAQIGDKLKNLSSQTEHAGMFLEVLSKVNQWTEDNFEARKTLDLLSATAPLHVRSSAVFLLGMRAFRYGQRADAKRLLSESIKLSSIDDCAPLTRAQSINTMYLILSEEDAKKEAIELLKANHPYTLALGRVIPAVLGNQLNNIAYELCLEGNLDLAHRYSTQACAHPSAIHNPGWFETKAEIEQKLSEKPSRSFIAVPNSFEKFNERGGDNALKRDVDWRFVVRKTDSDPATIFRVRKAMWDGHSDIDSISKESGLDISTVSIISNALNEFDTLQRTRIN
jgi:hypothetical protein